MHVVGDVTSSARISFLRKAHKAHRNISLVLERLVLFLSERVTCFLAILVSCGA